jgi:hypothetical protein
MMRFIQAESDNASVDLARVRGVYPGLQGLHLRPARRGSVPATGARTTIAPTGTTAQLAELLERLRADLCPDLCQEHH